MMQVFVFAFFQGLVSFFCVVGGLYLLYLIFLIIRAFTELKALPYMSKYKYINMWGNRGEGRARDSDYIVSSVVRCTWE